MVRLLVAFLLLVAGSTPAFARQDDKAVAAQFDADAFDQDAARHVEARRRVGAMRGFGEETVRIRSLENLTAHLAAGNPAYPDGTAVLFYAHSGDRLAIYLVTARGIVAHDAVTISPDALRLLANRHRRELDVEGLALARAPQWIGNGAPPTTPPAPPASAAPPGNPAIADVLLPPAIRTALLDVRHLVIVAGGVIASTPFAAFPLTADEMLVDRMSITVSAGLYDLDQMIRPWAGRAEFLAPLVVGDPHVPATPDWRVPPLPGAAREARMLAERVSAVPLLGRAATKSAVVERMGSARMLYFAAHGVSDPRNPLAGGYLMLSGPSRDEAFLTAGEVQQMRLSANLVVLSACQSGLGYNHDGGVIGLARAFQKAGAPRVVMSLWSVSDEATLYLMDRFQLAAMEHMPAEALRLAMLDARKKYPEPALWAAFTLFGTPR